MQREATRTTRSGDTPTLPRARRLPCAPAGRQRRRRRSPSAHRRRVTRYRRCIWCPIPVDNQPAGRHFLKVDRRTIDGAGEHSKCVPAAASSLAGKGRAHAMEPPALVLPTRDGRITHGAADARRAPLARPEAEARGPSRPALPRMVPADVAKGPNVRRGDRRFSLVARGRRALVRAHAPPSASAAGAGAPGQPAEAPPPHAGPAPRLHRATLHHRVAPLSQAEPPRRESRSDARRAATLRRGGRALAALAAALHRRRRRPVRGWLRADRRATIRLSLSSCAGPRTRRVP